MTIQASANRDEEIHENGESVHGLSKPPARINRSAMGPHFCQGTHVARRAVGQVMLPMLFDRFPEHAHPEPR